MAGELWRRGQPAKDYAGVRVGRLTFRRPTGGKIGKGLVWSADCECGGETTTVPAQAARMQRKYDAAGRGVRVGCKACGLTAKRTAGRNAEIVREFAGGSTLGRLAGRYGITRQRADQIVARGLSPGDVDAVLGTLDRDLILRGVLALPARHRRRVLYAALLGGTK